MDDFVVFYGFGLYFGFFTFASFWDNVFGFNGLVFWGVGFPYLFVLVRFRETGLFSGVVWVFGFAVVFFFWVVVFNGNVSVSSVVFECWRDLIVILTIGVGGTIDGLAGCYDDGEGAISLGGAFSIWQ